MSYWTDDCPYLKGLETRAEAWFKSTTSIGVAWAACSHGDWMIDVLTNADPELAQRTWYEFIEHMRNKALKVWPKELPLKGIQDCKVIDLKSHNALLTAIYKLNIFDVQDNIPKEIRLLKFWAEREINQKDEHICTDMFHTDWHVAEWKCNIQEMSSMLATIVRRNVPRAPGLRRRSMKDWLSSSIIDGDVIGLIGFMLVCAGTAGLVVTLLGLL